MVRVVRIYDFFYECSYDDGNGVYGRRYLARSFMVEAAGLAETGGKGCGYSHPDGKKQNFASSGDLVCGRRRREAVRIKVWRQRAPEGRGSGGGHRITGRKSGGTFHEIEPMVHFRDRILDGSPAFDQGIHRPRGVN